MAWLEVQHLHKTEYGLKVVSEVHSTLKQGEKLAIMGETGSPNPLLNLTF
jgi:ABC-type lipoprotein export system ATPase subunit